MKKSKKILLVISIVLSMITLVGFVSNFDVEKPEMKRVLIRYVMAGETEPFDLYNEKHAVGDEIAVASPQVLGGYTPRISVYKTTVKSDINVTVLYDFKAPDVPVRENAVMYSAKFENVDTYEEAFDTYGTLKATSVGNHNNDYVFDFSDGMLHSSGCGYILLEDQESIFSADAYTVSFSMLFKTFSENKVATAFSWSFGNYNGGSSTAYGKAMRLDTSGKVYLNDATHVTSLQTDKWYTFTLYVDNTDLTCELFIDGVSFGKSQMYDPEKASSTKFRLFNADSMTEYYLDNLVIYEGTPVKK